MRNSKEPESIDFEKMTDKKVISLVVDGLVSRNRCYDFFKTKRGVELFKKARIIMGFLKDLENGAEIISEENEKERVLITLENKNEKYKRTVFMDKIMYSVFSLKK